jgi:hypothetical protein
MSAVHRGVHRLLEEEADRILQKSVKKDDGGPEILTQWKQRHRREHEVYVPSGTPDASVRRGSFRRARNTSRPDLNSREGVPQGHRITQRQATFTEEYHDFG